MDHKSNTIKITCKLHEEKGYYEILDYKVKVKEMEDSKCG